MMPAEKFPRLNLAKAKDLRTRAIAAVNTLKLWGEPLTAGKFEAVVSVVANVFCVSEQAMSASLSSLVGYPLTFENTRQKIDYLAHNYPSFEQGYPVFMPQPDQIKDSWSPIQISKLVIKDRERGQLTATGHVLWGKWYALEVTKVLEYGSPFLELLQRRCGVTNRRRKHATPGVVKGIKFWAALGRNKNEVTFWSVQVPTYFKTFNSKHAANYVREQTKKLLAETTDDRSEIAIAGCDNAGSNWAVLPEPRERSSVRVAGLAEPSVARL